MNAPRPWRVLPGGLELRLRVTPKARRDALDGIVADAGGRPLLGLRVAAPPAGGAANRAVIAFLARALGVPKSAVAVAAGAGARIKTVAVGGDPGALSARLEALVGR